MTQREQIQQQLVEVNGKIDVVEAEYKDAISHLGEQIPNDAPMEVRMRFEENTTSRINRAHKELEDLMKQRELLTAQLAKPKPSLETSNSSISKFTISPLEQPINGTVAVCSATFYNTLTVNGITINEGKSGLYVRMPQKRTKQGNYIDVAHPLSSDGRRNINQTLLTAYKNNVFHQELTAPEPNKVLAQNSVKYPPEYGNSLARLDIVVDDMVVHNAKIMKSGDSTHLLMPTYKSKDGKYTSICAPASKDKYAEFNLKANEEFNADYSFRKFDDDTVSKLKDSSVNIQVHKNKKGENIVKFKTADLEKVNAIVYNKAIPTVKT